MTTKCGAFIGTSGDVKPINEVIPNSVHIISQYNANPVAIRCIAIISTYFRRLRRIIKFCTYPPLD
ncbi:MAG: hypothetical protein IPG59_04070 [Candidatus Melainabacteria bacterium]|nr:MAG: hypothetical protein IPG59_04070 [Candidatus Melainabacteria bacterium]